MKKILPLLVVLGLATPVAITPAFADSTSLFVDSVPGTHEVAVTSADGETYTVHSAVGVSVDRAPVLIAQADTQPTDAGRAVAQDAGSASATETAPATGSGSATTPAPAPPQVSDVPVMTKLWKNGSFLGFGIMALYLALFAWLKLDKKHAFYAATALGGVGLIVEMIRKGDLPSATMMMSTLLPSIGIMITGPGHEKTAAPGN